jgi:hypothetical protein
MEPAVSPIISRRAITACETGLSPTGSHMTIRRLHGTWPAAASPEGFLIGFLPLKFQLVLQWPVSSMNDYNEMVNVEDLLIERFTKRCEVDGHDFGSNEANIFVNTNDPRRTFEEIRTILSGHKLWPDTRIAFRQIDGNEYTVIWPEGATTFNIS